jgi:pullulanase/glycogen debranching enzyme
MWLRPDGGEMGAKDWSDPMHAAIAFRLDGDAIDVAPARDVGHDDSFLVMMNGARYTLPFTTPPAALGSAWRVVVDTRDAPRTGQVVDAGAAVEVGPGSLLVLIEAR